MKALCVVCTALFVAIILGGVWWWALAGMSSDIATAWAITGLLVGTVGAVSAVGFME
jgi:hypothetical protein